MENLEVGTPLELLRRRLHAVSVICYPHYRSGSESIVAGMAIRTERSPALEDQAGTIRRSFGILGSEAFHLASRAAPCSIIAGSRERCSITRFEMPGKPGSRCNEAQGCHTMDRSAPLKLSHHAFIKATKFGRKINATTDQASRRCRVV